MVVRIVMAAALIAFLLLLLYVFPVWVIPLAMAAFSVASVYELLYATGFVKQKRLVACAAIFAAIVPFWVYWGQPENLGSVLVYLFVLAIFINAILDHQNISFQKIGMTFLSGMLAAYLLSSVMRIYFLPETGRQAALIPFITAYINDTFALLVGMSIGKRKIAPGISPKKTVEGFLGGIAGTVAAMLLYGVILQRFCGLRVSFPLFALIGAVGALAAFAGDLSMSYVKRQAGIKDFGKIFPGHGGVMDRLDSLVFAAPAVEILLLLIPGVFK